MLLKRVITAIVLLLVLAIDLSVPSRVPLLVFFSVAVGVAAFEWLRLTAPKPTWVAPLSGLPLGLLAFWQSFRWDVTVTPLDLNVLKVSVIVCALIWLFIVPVRLWTATITHAPKSLGWSLFAPVCLYATWGSLAIVWLEGGAWHLLSLLTLIWIADIFAYFGGKRFGRHKLAPNISPGKTREGALIGLAGALAWLVGTAFVSGSFAQKLLQLWGWVPLVLFGLVLGMLAILGDLFESYLKRQADVKDSSRLLPGHGGVYDRVDAVVAVVPVAYFLISDFWY